MIVLTRLLICLVAALLAAIFEGAYLAIVQYLNTGVAEYLNTGVAEYLNTYRLIDGVVVLRLISITPVALLCSFMLLSRTMRTLSVAYIVLLLSSSLIHVFITFGSRGFENFLEVYLLSSLVFILACDGMMGLYHRLRAETPAPAYSAE